MTDDEQAIRTSDLERLDSDVEFELKHVEKAADSYLPGKIIDDQVLLSHRTRLELQERMVACAVAIALRSPGLHPARVLDMGAETARARMLEWEDKTMPELLRVLEGRGKS